MYLAFLHVACLMITLRHLSNHFYSGVLPSAPPSGAWSSAFTVFATLSPLANGLTRVPARASFGGSYGFRGVLVFVSWYLVESNPNAWEDLLVPVALSVVTLALTTLLADVRRLQRRAI